MVVDVSYVWLYIDHTLFKGDDNNIHHRCRTSSMLSYMDHKLVKAATQIAYKMTFNKVKGQSCPFHIKVFVICSLQY